MNFYYNITEACLVLNLKFPDLSVIFENLYSPSLVDSKQQNTVVQKTS